MLRWLTAGESHGPALVTIVEGMVAGLELTTDDLREALARRRLGYGRGARMKFEADEVELLGGVRHGRTLGSPIAIRPVRAWRTARVVPDVHDADLRHERRDQRPCHGRLSQAGVPPERSPTHPSPTDAR